MPTVLYIFYPAGTLCNPVYVVATPPVDCTCLSEDDLYCLKYGNLLSDIQYWYAYQSSVPLYIVPEIHTECNGSLQIFRYFRIMMHFQLTLYVSI